MAFEAQLDSTKCEKNAYDIAESMTAQYGISWNDLHACIDGPDGQKYQHQMAVETGQLSPAHTYVPWIVVNGVHNSEEQVFTHPSLNTKGCSIASLFSFAA